MITELLQERAALYAAGTMTSREREQFEIVLEFYGELRSFVSGLLETSATVIQGTALEELPPLGMKSRVMELISGRVQQQPDAGTGFVMTGMDGLVQWVNPAFTAMCGYELEELSGKNPGSILQGRETDQVAVGRLRDAVRGLQPCHETILNYHKNGTAYWVEIDITPIVDEQGTPLWLVARERELAAPAGA